MLEFLRNYFNQGLQFPISSEWKFALVWLKRLNASIKTQQYANLFMKLTPIKLIKIEIQTKDKGIHFPCDLFYGHGLYLKIRRMLMAETGVKSTKQNKITRVFLVVDWIES